MQRKKELMVFIAGSSWSLLGFKRGLNYYDYNHDKHANKETYLYISKVQQGCFGFFFYCNPIFLPFNVYKEIYRLEVNIRGLEEEKKTPYYNNYNMFI